MRDRWYKQAIVYSLDVATFQDSNGDGIGDLPGLISRLDYLARLGVTCLWLNPIHPSPNRDDRYDVADYYAIDPVLGSLGDFAQLLHLADNLGIRVLMDLVANHTSDQHPWFQSAKSDPQSPYRDWYVWSETEPPDRYEGMVFPGQQDETWTWLEEAGAFYYHRFYDYQPDVNWANPQVRNEFRKIMGFWLQLGVAGFRVDATPFVIEITHGDGRPPTRHFDILDDWSQFVSWRRGDAVLLAEANVSEHQVGEYFVSQGGSGQRFHMLFAFLLNARVFLALARQNPEPIVESLGELPELPEHAQWATFLRNHDELDLSRLTTEQRAEVFRAFGPKPDMQLYGRGLRRRMATMLGGDQRRIRMAYSLQFTLPGTPVLRYGEELGMGEDLSLPGRTSIRTAMQWSDGPGAGFTSAEGVAQPGATPVITRGPFGAKQVNADLESQSSASLLGWFERMLVRLRECPEIGSGRITAVDVPLPPGVLVHRAASEDGEMLFLHNLGPDDVVVDLGVEPLGLTVKEGMRLPVFDDIAPGEQGYGIPSRDLTGLELRGYGYRWIRLRRSATVTSY
ncbi:MAG: alpha-amylase family protein [Actinomycetes bacterium]